jgi:hypothetical protein
MNFTSIDLGSEIDKCYKEKSNKPNLTGSFSNRIGRGFARLILIRCVLILHVHA